MALKRNQKVRLSGCAEADMYTGVFTCKCDEYDYCGVQVVRLKELGGYWRVEVLEALTQKQVKEINN